MSSAGTATPSSPESVPGAARAGRAAGWAALSIRVVRWVVAGVIAAWSVLLLAWLTFHWAILPNIAQWRAPIEKRAGEALGVPLRIGNIVVRSSGWVPSLELQDVALLDARGEPALKLPRVFAAFSPRSLLAMRVGFEQLLIDGAELEIRRDADGRILVAGLDFSGGSQRGRDGGSGAADWFFAQREFIVRGGSLRWVDDLRRAPPLALGDVQLVVRNSLRGHEIRIDATPPAAWGERFSLRGRFSHPLLAGPGDWRRWSGSAYADLPRADVSELRRHLTLPFDLTQGDGALRAWVDLRDGLPQSATVDLALRAVTLRLADSAGQPLAPLEFQQVQGRLAGRTGDGNGKAGGGAISAQRFGFLTADGIAWPRSDVALSWQQRAGGPTTAGEFKAERLDLALMSQVATRLPLGAPLRALLAELRPEGVMSAVQARWRGPLDAPSGYEVQAKLAGLSLAAHAADAPQGGVGRPGLRNAAVQLSATEKGGEATLAIEQGALDLPGVFAEPLVPLTRWNSRLSWRIEPLQAAGGAELPPKVTLQVKDARFANADAAGELRATWSNSAGGPGNGAGRVQHLPGWLELDGKLSQGNATRVARYLPLGIPAETRQYVAQAVLSGGLRNVAFRVNGDLAEFPFGHARSAKDGEFRIAGHVDNASFAFIPASATTPAASGAAAWPPLTALSGELIFDRAAMEIRGAQAQLGGVALKNVRGGILTLGERPVLKLEGGGTGALPEMLRFVNATPIGGWIDKALAQTTASGNAELALKLNIPLSDVKTATVAGSVTLASNNLRLAPEAPPLAAARGRVEFDTRADNRGVRLVGGSARVFGGESSFDGGTQPDGTLRFAARGSVNAAALKRSPELGALARAAEPLNGQTRYEANFALVRGKPELTLTSNLVGLAIDLPAPLRKAADTPLALRVQNRLSADAGPGTGTGPLRDTLRVELGNVLQAVYLRDLSGEAPRVLRGGIGVQEAALLPASGVAANVNLGSVNADVWEAALARLMPPAAAAPGGAMAPAAASATAFADYAPTSIGLRAQELVFGGKRLTKLVAGLSVDDGLWRANLWAEQLGGYVEYRAPRRLGTASLTSDGRVFARLSHLSIPKGSATDDATEPLLDAPPASVPALDVTVDDFELRGKRLGRVEIEAVNRIDAGVRVWRLNRLALITPEARLSASGNWTAPAAGGPGTLRRATMNFKLEMADSGALLDRLGMGRTVRGGKGSLVGQVAWAGSPLSIDYPSLGGQVTLALDAGQFLRAEPGAARLLGVLSLQSLPRRLLLDFRDVFQQGFAFDNITGEVQIAEGVARSSNLRMRGLQATVAMAGSADLKRETQDLRVAVVPEVNAGAASLAYAAINPALGLGTFLAQLLLRKPLQAAGTREFHVTGPWAEPKVEPIERRLGEAPPVLDAAASAPQQ